MLELRNLKVSYGLTEVLKGISLEVPDGATVALLGGNGSGKSTTLNAVSGFLRPTAGSILFAGQRIDGKRTDEVVRLGVVQVPQGREVFATMTVRQNLVLGATTRGDGAGIRRDLEQVLETFPALAARQLARASTLSGGEQQMLAIGRALMSRPKLLLMDEPSAGLAPRMIEEIVAVIQKIQKQGATILLVEQNIGLALSLAHHAYVLRFGDIALAGRPDRLLATPEVVRSYLGG